MKIRKIIFFTITSSIILLFCQNCKTNTFVNNKSILNIKENYVREEGVFHLGNDSMDIDYVIKWRKKADNREKKAFLPNIRPSVKDTIAINFFLESLSPNYRYEKISIYIDNTLIKEDTIPSRYAYSEYFPTFPEYFSTNYHNKNKHRSAKITIALHTQKVFFDTIIPLRFNIIDIKRLGGNFDFAFSGVY
jgi:hypothetical protein